MQIIIIYFVKKQQYRQFSTGRCYNNKKVIVEKSNSRKIVQMSWGKSKLEQKNW